MSELITRETLDAVDLALADRCINRPAAAIAEHGERCSCPDYREIATILRAAAPLIIAGALREARNRIGAHTPVTNPRDTPDRYASGLFRAHQIVADYEREVTDR
jgi:hypothetical protein